MKVSLIMSSDKVQKKSGVGVVDDVMKLMTAVRMKNECMLGNESMIRRTTAKTDLDVIKPRRLCTSFPLAGVSPSRPVPRSRVLFWSKSFGGRKHEAQCKAGENP